MLAVERSILHLTDLTTAVPSVDVGIDLLAYQRTPFSVLGVQVKGATKGLTVWRKYSGDSIVVAYVLDPLLETPSIHLMSGEEAWRLPELYVERGGRASDHRATNETYRWPSTTKLLREVLTPFEATKERWAKLFELNKAQ